MPLLAFENVTLIDHGRLHDVVFLRDVSFELEAGEWVAVLCREEGSRKALTRVATGIFSPQSGVVRLDGQPLPQRRTRGVRRQLALCDSQLLRAHENWPGILPDNGPPRGGRKGVDRLLEPLAVPAPHLGTDRDQEPLERARASLAGALERRPRAVIVEGPVRSPFYLETQHVRDLAREIANQGIAVLMTTDEVQGAAGADRVLSLSHGELRGELKAPGAVPVSVRPR